MENSADPEQMALSDPNFKSWDLKLVRKSQHVLARVVASYKNRSFTLTIPPVYCDIELSLDLRGSMTVLSSVHIGVFVVKCSSAAFNNTS